MEIIEKERYLTVDKMAEIYSAFENLNIMLEDIKLPRVELENNTVTYVISPADILNKMNMVEKNITALHYRVEGKIIGWKDKYYKSFTWISRTCEKKSEVWRWIDWINSFHTMLSNVKIEYIPIHYTDGNAVYNLDGKPLHYIKRIYKEA